MSDESMTTQITKNLPEGISIIFDDCIKVMRDMSDNSVDAIVTDPPYGLGFMGKKWDDLPPGEEWARECLRVLKPGGHLLAFGGTRTWHRLAVAVEDAGFEMRDSIAWMYGTGFPKSMDVSKAIAKSKGAPPEVGQWEGWGTALKPGFEPIIVARKPLEGSTVVVNVLQHGTGAINIDACRIETDEDTRRNARGGSNGLNGEATFRIRERRAEDQPKRDGRWPANVILDEHAAAELDAQSGVTTSRAGLASRGVLGKSVYGKYAGDQMSANAGGLGDTGGASRFFYVAKAPKSEKPVVEGVAHPTVKPLSLMRHLVRLVTPPSGVVLEPFAGSGATVEACLLEGFDCIAIEREAEYLPLIYARIARNKEGE